MQHWQNPHSSQSAESEKNVLLTLECSSIVDGYLALAALTRKADVRILEASTVGGSRFWILAQGARSALEKGLALLQAQKEVSLPDRGLVSSELIESSKDNLLSLLFSLQQNELDESLVVVQTSSPTMLLRLAANALETGGLKGIELKVFKSSACGGFGTFTGTTEQCRQAVQSLEALMRQKNVKVEFAVIEKPEKSFRQFFNLSGTN